MGILSFLIENKTFLVIIAAIGIIVAQYAYISTLRSKNETLIAEKETLSTKLVESQANLKQLQNDIKTQNDAIDKLKKDSDIRAAKNAVEVKAAQEKANIHKSHAEELLKRIAPQDMSKCDAANLIINEEIKNAHK